MVDAKISAEEGTVEVDVAGELTKAILSRRPLHDPAGSRMRA
jgi:hypothetical protein